MMLCSLFSFKKLKYKGLSLFCLWDRTTVLSPKTHVRPFARLKSVVAGDYTRIGLNVAVTHTTIGKFTAIARNCLINVGRHPVNRISPHSIFYGRHGWKYHPEWSCPVNFEEYPRVTIGNDVWIGINCIVMGGVEIGDGAIIAAGSVVTRDVPPYAIVGGVPAKVIKYRFPQEMIDRLERIAWWNLPDEEITRKLEFFHRENPTMKDLEEFFPE